MSMTPEEMRIAIAEMCGWTPSYIGSWTKDPAGLRGPFISDLPNYPSDLNACHEMEKVIVDWVAYRIHLCKVAGIGYAPDLGICDDIKSFVSATALQRCEAFCRTLWPERFES